MSSVEHRLWFPFSNLLRGLFGECDLSSPKEKIIFKLRNRFVFKWKYVTKKRINYTVQATMYWLAFVFVIISPRNLLWTNVLDASIYWFRANCAVYCLIQLDYDYFATATNNGRQHLLKKQMKKNIFIFRFKNICQKCNTVNERHSFSSHVIHDFCFSLQNR